MDNSIITNCVNGPLRPGDLVASIPDDGDVDYAYLVGEVMEIILLGTKEHDTGNETDDVHVDFTVEKYSEQRVKEIEAAFSDLYQQRKPFSDCPLDYSIMSPECLIRITGIDKETLVKLLQSEAEAALICSRLIDAASKKEFLIGRLHENEQDSKSDARSKHDAVR